MKKYFTVLALILVALIAVPQAQAPTFQGARASILVANAPTGYSSFAVTFAVPFADADYTVSCSVQDVNSGAKKLTVVSLGAIAFDGVVVNVSNNTTGVRSGVLHCVAIHD